MSKIAKRQVVFDIFLRIDVWEIADIIVIRENVACDATL